MKKGITKTVLLLSTILGVSTAFAQKETKVISPAFASNAQIRSEQTSDNQTIEKVDSKKDPGWKLGIALYTFNPSPLEEQFELVRTTGLTYIEGYTFGKAGPELKDSLIMNLSPSGLDKLYQTIEKSGLKMESIYVIGGKTIDKWVKDFEIAKHLKVRYVTAEPPVNLLNSVDSLAGVYGIKVALHNHWKGTSQYWHPDSVLAALKNHPNMGACPDVGHWPKSGINPTEGIKKLSGHIMAMHLKDIAAYDNPKLKDVTVGTGVIKFPEIFAELKRQKFSGNMMIERDQQDKPNNLVSVTESIRYYKETVK